MWGGGILLVGGTGQLVAFPYDIKSFLARLYDAAVRFWQRRDTVPDSGVCELAPLYWQCTITPKPSRGLQMSVFDKHY